MDNTSRIDKLREDDYLELFGVRKPTFEKMLCVLEGAFTELHGRGGRTPRLSVLDKLVVTLGYYHDYRTMKNIAFDYGVSKSRISDAVKWAEQTLLRDGAFALPSKREMLKTDTQVVIAVVDATECETERPQKKRADRIPGRRSDTSSRTRS
ncbi:MAG: transposase family protein [Kiritimatiellaeota bacterium]|nr:transposase family protein [Kiritimatiellota bacterium]